MARNKSDNWVRNFDVSDPRKHSKGFTVYKVTSIVFPKTAPEAVTKVVVWKRYNDFKKLHSKLKQFYKSCKIKEEFPKLSKAKYFNRFEDDVLKERIESILSLLMFIGKYQALFTSTIFSEFFENGYQLVDNIQSRSSCDMLDNGNVEVSEDGADSATTYQVINGRDTKSANDGLLKLGGTWDALVATDTISVHSRSSDDTSVFVSASDTTSLCSIPTSNSFESTLKNDTEVEDPAAGGPCRMVQSVCADMDKHKTEEEELMFKSTSCLPDHMGETVTCHSEKPITPSEMWLSVTTEDFKQGKHSGCVSGTPPVSPLDSQPQDYIVQAAYHVGQAQSHEVAGEYEASFSFYKGAIACLLSGVHDDRDKARRVAVRDKITRYLQRAEKMYTMHLASEISAKVPPSVTELKVYKVLGVLDQVMLVLNTEEDRCYVMKVLPKSPWPVNAKKKTIVPRNVPYMVQLEKQLESDNSVFLVLQYAGGGRLWDHIGNYLQSTPSTPIRAAEPQQRPDTSQEEGSYLDLIHLYTTGQVTLLDESETPTKEETREASDDGLDPKEPSPTMPDLIQDTGSINSLETSDLVVNAQRLLESVNKTLQKSETVTSSLSRDLEHMEALDLDKRLAARQEERSKKRSTSAVPRPRFERRFSDDLAETRSRTSSSSLDRCGQWSRFASMVDSASTRLPERTIIDWAAELLVALETLHRWGIVCKDLRPDNLLLGDQGHVLLTFQSQWREVDSVVSPAAVTGLYAAPEVTKVFPLTPAADWWSFGALLYQLLTGQSLVSAHPSGVLGHTILTLPGFLSTEACSLLTQLLRYEPSERLGGGLNGSDDVKNHPFFRSVDWQLVYSRCKVI